MPFLGSDNNLDVTITTKADTAGVTQTQEKISDLNRTAEEGGNKVESFSGRMGALADSIRTVGSYIAGYQLIQFFQGFASLSFGGAGELEQTNMAFQSMVGNLQEANSVFGQLVQYANTTPFQSKDIEAAARTLMGFGTAGQQTVDIIKQLGDVVSVGGGDMQALSLVTGQIFAQGKLRAQDMYQVINAGGAGLVKIMAQNAGGMQKLTDEFNNGGIPAKQYFDAINQATAQGGFAFQGANKEAETLNGRLSTLKDAVQQFAMKLIGVKIDPQLGLVIEPGGLFDRAKGIIEGMTAALSKIGDNKDAIIAISGALGGVFLGTILAIVIAIGWIPLAIIGVTAAVGAGVALIVTHWQKWHDQIIIIGGLLFGVVGIVAAIVALIIMHWDKVKSFFGAVMDWIKEKAVWLKDNWLSLLGEMLIFVATFPIKMPLYIADAMNKIIDLISRVNWGSVFRGMLTAIGDVASSIWNAVKWAFDKIMALNWGGIMAGIGKGIANAIIDLINGAIKGAFDGVPVLKDHVPHLAHFASGVTNYRGSGLALIGENGPELVALPQGASVYTNAQSQAMMRGTTNNKTTSIGTVIINTPQAADRFFKNLDQDILNVGRGLTTNRGMTA